MHTVLTVTASSQAPPDGALNSGGAGRIISQQHRTSTARRWTLEVEILKEALECSRPKSGLAYALVAVETIR
jgi:hypothetical protein